MAPLWDPNAPADPNGSDTIAYAPSSNSMFQPGIEVPPPSGDANDSAALPPAASDGAAARPNETTHPPDIARPNVPPPAATGPPHGSYTGNLPSDASATPNDPEVKAAGAVSPAAATDGSTFDQVLADAEALLAQGKIGNAHLQLSQWYDDPRLGDQQNTQLVELLGQLAGTVLYSIEPVLEGDQHIVRYGQTLDEIGQQYNVPAEVLAKINGIPLAGDAARDPATLRQGDKLKVVRGPFHVKIDLQSGWVSLTVHERYAGRFRILNVGRDAPLGRVSGPLDVRQKSNFSGEFIIDFGSGIVVHSEEATRAEGATRRDCISLSPQDAEDLYHILSASGPAKSRATVRQ
jgi:hypothetical protein